MNNKQENIYIGCNIRRFRIKAGITEAQLAITVSRHHRKMTRKSLNGLEQGAYRASPMRLYHIAAALNISMEKLVE